MPLVHHFARLAGWAVLAVALGFLGYSLWQSAPWTLAAARSAELAFAIGVGASACGLAGFLLAEAWRHLLGAGAGVARKHYYAVYGRTQIAKYLPGNCFHFVGRQLLGRRLGHGHGALALASVAESALLLAVAGALALPLLGPKLAEALTPAPAWPVAALALASAGLMVAVVRAGGARSARAVSHTLDALRSLAPRLPRAGLLYLAFFAVGGLALWTLAAAIGAPGAAIDFRTAVCALALAWCLGFVIPGAAAGLGVREAVLVLSLHQHVGGEGAVLVALALRVVTTLGDLLFFGLCCLAPAHLRTEVPGAR